MILYLYIEFDSHGGFPAAKSYYDPIESGCQGGFPGNQETTKLRPFQQRLCTDKAAWTVH